MQQERAPADRFIADLDASSAASRWFPLLPILRGYGGALAKRDIVAGLTVALFTIPQAMAYALIAGFPPALGIATAVVASILGAIFGSSEFLVNGPTNAICVMIASNAAIIASHGDYREAVVLLTLMIGVGQCLAAAVKAGTFTRFVSEPVLTGFTAGAGLYIAVNQLPAFFGIEKAQIAKDLGGWIPPHNAVFDFLRTVVSIGAANWAAIGVALATIALVRFLLWIEPRTGRRLPAPFLTVVVVSIGAFVLGLGDPARAAAKIKLVQDIEPVTRTLPTFAWPTITWERVEALLGPMFAIGLLGAVEAIAIGKALASKAGHRFNANHQLIGEGACNLGAALVGGFAASGSFSRTAVNHDAGAVTRMSVIFSGLLVMAIVWLFAPAANFVPIAVLAGMLVHIGIKLVNVGKIRLIHKATLGDRRALIITFVAVLVTPDLAYALFLGVGLSILSALRRAEGFKLAHLVEDASGNLVERPLHATETGNVVAIDLQGELFFAAAEELEHQLRRLLRNEPVFIVLRLQQAYNMDMTCAETLATVGAEAKRRGGRLILSGIRPGMMGTLERAGVLDELGKDCVFAHEPTLLGSTHRAIDYAQKLAGV